jgi:hypothetical protein
VQIEPRSLGRTTTGPDGAPVFLTAGSRALGEFRCVQCGYGVIVRRLLPECPMCRGRSWEDPSTSPYAPSRV